MTVVTRQQKSSVNSMNIRDLTPMGPPKAAGLVARLLRGYPYLNLGEGKLRDYSASLVDVLQSYPAWVGDFAINRVKKNDNTDFLPSDRTVRKWCEDTVGSARDIAAWNARARLALPPPEKPAEPDTTLEERARAARLLEQQALRARGPIGASDHMQRVLADIAARKASREDA